jgi:hypothetical protein
MQTNVNYISAKTSAVRPFLGYIWPVHLKPKVKDMDSKL